MCGIAGLLMLDGSGSPEGLIEKMIETLSHRGPDGQGVHRVGPVALGHRRLSIIDLSEAGNQPMCNEDGTIWITYNGEIYNFADLRPELEKAGHQFRSNTDTEVVLHAYEQWGLDCLPRFNGMFAFGLWDDNRKRLWVTCIRHLCLLSVPRSRHFCQSPAPGAKWTTPRCLTTWR
jgi:asparagine synthase (glutamine-hydrolysing)